MENNDPFEIKLCKALGDKVGTINMDDLFDVLGIRPFEQRATKRFINAAMDRMGWSYDVAYRRFTKDGQTRPLIARGGVVLAPVAWRVKDFGDDWILLHTETEARREAAGAENLVQPLYAVEP